MSGKPTIPEELERGLSLHSDVLYSLLTVRQMAIDIAEEEWVAHFTLGMSF